MLLAALKKKKYHLSAQDNFCFLFNVTINRKKFGHSNIFRDENFSAVHIIESHCV